MSRATRNPEEPSKYCDGLCEDPDPRIGIEPEAEACETVDARRMFRELEKQFDAGKMPARGDELLDCVEAGMQLTEIAEELGISRKPCACDCDECASVSRSG